jgi:hypothetical protein
MAATTPDSAICSASAGPEPSAQLSVISTISAFSRAENSAPVRTWSPRILRFPSSGATTAIFGPAASAAAEAQANSKRVRALRLNIVIISMARL